jgi:hypothetical protein
MSIHSVKYPVPVVQLLLVLVLKGKLTADFTLPLPLTLPCSFTWE